MHVIAYKWLALGAMSQSRCGPTQPGPAANRIMKLDRKMERAKGFEPSTPTLAKLYKVYSYCIILFLRRGKTSNNGIMLCHTKSSMRRFLVPRLLPR